MNPGFDMLPKKVQDNMTKKSPAEHNENKNLSMSNLMAGVNANQGMPGTYNATTGKRVGGGIIGMLGTMQNKNESAIGSGIVGAQTGQALIPKETRKRKGGSKKRRGMGALDMFSDFKGLL